MPSELVLITGGTGHVGFKVIVDTLERGYSVRAAIRDSSKSAEILATKSIKALNPGDRLSFIVVPNITADGAYDEAVRGVKFVIHIASPLAKATIQPDKYETELINPAIKGTVGMLKSAHRMSGIKRVVITASCVSIVPTMAILGGSDDVFDESSQADALPAPYPHVFVPYCSSKILAYKATNDFIANEKPAFDVVSLMPSYIIGKNELVTDPKNITDGTNGLAFGQILGNKNPDGLSGCSVHVNDVSKAHVLALESSIPGNSHFILNSGGVDGTVWSDAIEIVAKNFPQAVAAGTLPNNGVMGSKRSRISAKKTEEIFGMKFLSFEEQVKSVTNHYLELIAAK
jgi:nucleoside-diphosphate-sugar epimerase